VIARRATRKCSTGAEKMRGFFAALRMTIQGGLGMTLPGCGWRGEVGSNPTINACCARVDPFDKLRAGYGVPERGARWVGYLAAGKLGARVAVG
jgi:hypothetical protein